MRDCRFRERIRRFEGCVALRMIAEKPMQCKRGWRKMQSIRTPVRRRASVRCGLQPLDRCGPISNCISTLYFRQMPHTLGSTMGSCERQSSDRTSLARKRRALGSGAQESLVASRTLYTVCQYPPLIRTPYRDRAGVSPIAW